jgi:hypothetical protein
MKHAPERDFRCHPTGLFEFIPPIAHFKDAGKHSIPNLFLTPPLHSIVALE